MDPGWSPDGSLLVFGQGADVMDPAPDLRLFKMCARQVSTLPASNGLFSPRWSPDGRYIAALRVKSEDVVIFDLETRRWAELVKGPAA